MSTYCTRENLEAYYGPVSIATWADLSGNEDQSEITARINSAISEASNELNDRLRGGPYAVPLQDMPDTPQTIRQIAVWLAGVWLYNSRGAQDFNEEGEGINRLSGDHNRALTTIREIHAGIVQIGIDGVMSTTAMEVVPVKTTRDDMEQGKIGEDESRYWYKE